ncbi:MAG: 3-methyl-2-oxobutanoate dehydrogenase subunit beta [Candidatus Hodarchaeota archaeon]
MVSIKELAKTEKHEYFLRGNSCCAGCGLEIALRWTLKALGHQTIVVAPASCTNVVIGLYPRTAPTVPFINMAFAAGAAATAGIRTALKARGINDITCLCWAGDGGTYDIGIQALSGAAERGDDIMYICYDNEAYMNTGTQRSGGTPYGAWTTTTPFGKKQHKKNLPMIMAAHGIPYVATASAGYPLDLYNKVKKAKDIRGCKYIHIFAACPPGWRYDTELTIEISKKAVETGFWILYEIEDGVINLNGPSKSRQDKAKRKPIEEYLKPQGRFNKMSEQDIKNLQAWVDRQWEVMAQKLVC